MTTPEMQFTETAILLAHMEDDAERVKQLIAEMLPGERKAFWDQLTSLRQLVDLRNYCGHCTLYVEQGKGVSVGFIGGPRELFHAECREERKVVKA